MGNVFHKMRAPLSGSVQLLEMQSFQFRQTAKPVSTPLVSVSHRAAPCEPTVQMVVRVAIRDAGTARRALHRMLGSTIGVHTIDLDHRRDVACLHVVLARGRVGEAMTLLIRTVSSAEFGTVRQLERG
ncbi:hypothetical protein [Paraburkholderia adhaesiva]|uniref:hypothetical protein n=1 Tax=Paraburkholderia adhaesiva TaxID=2883244 RepID=UPI001F1D4AA8|nr:hypothetical protein [Paraburkholderia adhaesiva]